MEGSQQWGMAEQGRAEVDSLDHLGTAAAPVSALLGKRRVVVGGQLDTGGNQHLRGPEGGSQSAEGRGQEQPEVESDKQQCRDKEEEHFQGQ